MKSTLHFNLPEDKDEFENAWKGSEYKAQLDEIWNECLRPAFKHGYNNSELNKLLENEDVYKAIEILSEMYQKIRNTDV